MHHFKLLLYYLHELKYGDSIMFLNLIIDCYQNSDCDADGYCIQGYCIKGDGRLSMNDINVQLYV